MLFRLSRVSFWLAAAAAALALLAPGERATRLTVVSMIASAAAFGLWRSAVSGQRQSHARESAVSAAPVLTDAALTDAATTLVHAARSAPDFESALQAVARVLRAELGARLAFVVEVRDIDATHALIADLIESAPGFRAVPRRVRLDAAPLAQALRTQREAGCPPGDVVVPIVVDGRVVAAIDLRGIELAIDSQALADLLALARRTLSGPVPAPAAADTPQRLPAGSLEGHVLVVQDTIVKPELAGRLLQRLGCEVTPASGMLDAQEALGRTQFDLVLVDMRDSGFGAVRGAGAPVVAITEAGLSGDASRLRELGFDDHVCTPLRQREMHAVLSRYLRPGAAAESDGSSGAGPAPADAASVLDAGALARLAELDPKGENHLLERVLKAFQTSAARLRPQAITARANGDQAGLRLVAHTLKSSSASIGALQLSQICAQIEAAIRNTPGENLDPQLDALEASLAGVLVAIDTLLKERA